MVACLITLALVFIVIFIAVMFIDFDDPYDEFKDYDEED